MYIGSMGERGLYQLIFSLTEELLSAAKEKTIALKLLPQHVLEFSCESYEAKKDTGPCNDLTIASALGEFFEWQDEKQKIRTEKGRWISLDHEDVTARGMKLVWRADGSIFRNRELDYYIILNRMTELAALYPYTIYLSDGENQNKIVVPSGIEYFLKCDHSLFSSNKVLSIKIDENQFTARIAISFSCIHADTRKSYVNGQVTQEGGTHVDGVLTGARKALKKILLSYENSLTPGKLVSYMNYVIHVEIEKPSWCGNTKRRLANEEVKSVIQKHVEEQLYSFLKQDIQPLRSIYPSLFS